MRRTLACSPQELSFNAPNRTAALSLHGQEQSCHGLLGAVHTLAVEGRTGATTTPKQSRYKRPPPKHVRRVDKVVAAGSRGHMRARGWDAACELGQWVHAATRGRTARGHLLVTVAGPSCSHQHTTRSASLRNGTVLLTCSRPQARCRS